eukprot:COSAG01_NODE_14329_length_1467_cov_6.167398_1_plen_127_part_00
MGPGLGPGADCGAGRASVNQIGDAGAAALAKALESGQCGLKSLIVSGESPHPARTRVCGSAVRQGSGADGGAGRASDNQIGHAGAAALAKALESGQCGLTTLDLTGESPPRARVCLRRRGGAGVGG